MIRENLNEEKKDGLERVGFSESIIFRTCLDAAPAFQSPLTIRAQNFFELPVTVMQLGEDLHVYRLKLKNFKDQLRRKKYIPITVLMLITYLGAKKRIYPPEAGNDAEIITTARNAANETQCPGS